MDRAYDRQAGLNQALRLSSKAGAPGDAPGSTNSCGAGSQRAEDLRHRLASGKLVNELVEVADLLHERVPDLLYADATDHAGDELPRRIQRRGSAKNLSKSVPCSSCAP